MALSDADELALIGRAKAGDEQAMATLLQQHYEAVFRYMVKLTLDTQAARDATQDCMERAIRKIQSFDPEKAGFSTWLIAIARNRWMDGLRQTARHPMKPLDGALQLAQPDDAYEQFIDHDALLHALKGAKTEVRTAITMRYFLGYDYNEISSRMKIPLGTVKSRISNGLKQLRKELTR